MIRTILLAIALVAITPSAQAQTPSEDVHAVPIRAADRPLTLAQGSFRLDQTAVLRLGSGIALSGQNILSAGLTDWLEIGIAWPITRDPTFMATTRLAHGTAADLGVRVAVTAPAITTGDTDLVVSVPVVFRIAHIARIALAVSADLLLTQQISSIVRVPITITFNASARQIIGIEGSVSLVDHRFWHGDFGLFYAHTVSATAIRPIAEARLGASWELVTNAFMVTVGFSFWATALPLNTPSTEHEPSTPDRITRQ